MGEDLSLIHHRLDASFSYNSSFTHFLHRISLFRLFPVDLPDLAEASLTDAVEIVKVSLSQSYLGRVSLLSAYLRRFQFRTLA